MFRAVLYLGAVCAMHTIGIARRATVAEPEKVYRLDAAHGVAIICPDLTNDVQWLRRERVASEVVLIDGTESPETIEAIQVPLQALIDGVVSVRNRRFRSCSDAEALDLPDFNIKYLVVNDDAAVVGYFENAPAMTTAGG